MNLNRKNRDIPPSRQPGTEVAYVKEPSTYGKMTITEVAEQGHMWCVDADGVRCGPFWPEELGLAEEFYVPVVHTNLGLLGGTLPGA